MSNRTKLIIALAIVAVLAYAFFVFDFPYRKDFPDNGTTAQSSAQSSAQPATTTADLVFIEKPLEGSVISSPVEIFGQARGQWYFEAVFPVEVIGADGSTTLGFGQARANGSWTTDDFVPFTANISFDQGANTSGFIRLKKDNPSGDPAKDSHLDIPVTFAAVASQSNLR